MMKKTLLGLSLSLAMSSSFAAEVVVLAGDANTSSTGRWNYASSATMPYEGNRGMYSSVSSGINTYTFTPVLPETTNYTVEVYNSCYSPRSNHVIHNISYAEGNIELALEQDCQLDPFVGQWRTLGSYAFEAGNQGSVTIDTTGSNNSYVGATAVRFVYNSTNEPVNTAPSLQPITTNMTVNEGQVIEVSASASDLEDGDISSIIQWSALQSLSSGESFSVIASDTDFIIELLVTDSGGLAVTESIEVHVIPDQPISSFVYDFACQNLEPLPANFVTNKASALPQVGSKCGRYTAELTDNSNNRTLHYNGSQGRFDGVLVEFPFKVITRNIGIAPMNEPNANHVYDGGAYLFAGMQVHHTNFNQYDSAHLVVGQRGNTRNTIEGKTTRAGISSVTDIGAEQLPNGRADLMIEGLANGQLFAYWQLPNTSGEPSNDNWQPYNGTGQLPGTLSNWDSNQVYVGLITYAYGNSGLPFMGVANSLSVESP
jgi:hypothetical protein